MMKLYSHTHDTISQRWVPLPKQAGNNGYARLSPDLNASQASAYVQKAARPTYVPQSLTLRYTPVLVLCAFMMVCDKQRFDPSVVHRVA